MLTIIFENSYYKNQQIYIKNYVTFYFRRGEVEDALVYFQLGHMCVLSFIIVGFCYFTQTLIGLIIMLDQRSDRLS